MQHARTTGALKRAVVCGVLIVLFISLATALADEVREVGMSHTNSVGQRTAVERSDAPEMNAVVTTALIRLRSDLALLAKEHRILEGIEDAKVVQGSVTPPTSVINQSLRFARGQNPLPDPYDTPLTAPGAVVVDVLVTDRFALAKRDSTHRWNLMIRHHDMTVIYWVVAGSANRPSEKPIAECVYKHLYELVGDLEKLKD